MQANIISIFKSIDGEVNGFHQGRITTFLRMAECNLRCSFCDTPYSFKKGTSIHIEDIVTDILNFDTDKVTITGGEPLFQAEATYKIIGLLLDRGKKVSIETNGSIEIMEYLDNENVSWVVDYKLPSSGEQELMRIEAFSKLTGKDFVKFLIADKTDFDKSKVIKRTLRRAGCKATIAYGTVEGVIDRKTVAEWVINEGESDDVFNLQIHKVIWPECGADMER